MDALRGFGELSLGSRLKRISEYLMRETQIVYNHFNIDFDPFLFPIFKVISHKDGVTNTEIQMALKYTQPAITQAINKLNSKGYIHYKADDLDKRKKNIHLSEGGQKLLENINPLWQSIDVVIKDYTQDTSQSLIEHLNLLENKLEAKSFSETIINHIKMNHTKTENISILSYKKAYAKDFYDLNIEWLESFFYVEPYDREVLGNPETYIINKGGHIFFARLNDKIVGTVALMPIGDKGEFELTKMGVYPEYRGFKIGQKLMQHSIDFAKSLQLPKLIIYSNRLLENAIYIYKKYGFVEIPVEANCPYKRCDIKLELTF